MQIDVADRELSLLQLRMQSSRLARLLELLLEALEPLRHFEGAQDGWAHFEGDCPDPHLRHLFYG